MPHFIGADADKGRAVRCLNDWAQKLWGVEGVVPVAFGNHENDLALFQTLEELNGVGVIVAHPQEGRPEGRYWVDRDLIPPTVIQSPAACGAGILAAIPMVLDRLGVKTKR